MRNWLLITMLLGVSSQVYAGKSDEARRLALQGQYKIQSFLYCFAFSNQYFKPAGPDTKLKTNDSQLVSDFDFKQAIHRLAIDPNHHCGFPVSYFLTNDKECKPGPLFPSEDLNKIIRSNPDQKVRAQKYQKMVKRQVSCFPDVVMESDVAKEADLHEALKASANKSSIGLKQFRLTNHLEEDSVSVECTDVADKKFTPAQIAGRGKMELFQNGDDVSYPNIEEYTSTEHIEDDLSSFTKQLKERFAKMNLATFRSHMEGVTASGNKIDPIYRASMLTPCRDYMSKEQIAEIDNVLAPLLPPVSSAGESAVAPE